MAKNLDELVKERDYPPDVEQTVRTDLAKNGNEQRVLSGELVLPARQDAIHHHDRITGRAGMSDREKDLLARIEKLEKGEAVPPLPKKE